MSKEEKKLLIIDLCARLPYNTKCYNCYTEEDFTLSYVSDTDTDCHTFDYGYGHIEYIQPYLRPLSGMSENEKQTHEMFFNEDGLLDTSIDVYIDWLNEHHFDYRGLIGRGLALPAPEGMYNL